MRTHIIIAILLTSLSNISLAQKVELKTFGDAPFLFDDIASNNLFYVHEGKEYMVSYMGNHFGSIVKEAPDALKQIKIYRTKSRTSIALYSLAGLFAANFFIMNNNYAANHLESAHPTRNFAAINITGIIATVSSAFFLHKSGRDNVIRSGYYYTNYVRNNRVIARN